MSALGGFKDLTGSRFGMLTVAAQAERGKDGRIRWTCRCDCGGETTTSTSNLKSVKNPTLDCGCRGRAAAKSDHAGKRYGRLVAQIPVGSGWGRNIKWECLCDCGKTCEIVGVSLSNGTTKSCGCLSLDLTAAQGRRNATHGHTKGYGTTPVYSSWNNMFARCYNPKNKDYYLYGGRGIRVCDRWNRFENFLEDMGPTWEKGLTIDRYPNNDGNYEPGNCRWATRLQQVQNRRKYGHGRIDYAAAQSAANREVCATSNPTIPSRHES